MSSWGAIYLSLNQPNYKTMKHKRKLKNLLTKMLGELYCPEYQATTYEAGDIPTRRTVDQYLPKIENLFLDDEIKRLKKLTK